MENYQNSCHKTSKNQQVHKQNTYQRTRRFAEDCRYYLYPAVTCHLCRTRREHVWQQKTGILRRDQLTQKGCDVDRMLGRSWLELLCFYVFFFFHRQKEVRFAQFSFEQPAPVSVMGTENVNEAYVSVECVLNYMLLP